MADDLTPGRIQFVRDNAVSLVAELEAKVDRQRDELARLNRSRDDLRRENARLRDETGNAEECLSVAEHDLESLRAACREALARLEGLPDGARGFDLAAAARLLNDTLAAAAEGEGGRDEESD